MHAGGVVAAAEAFPQVQLVGGFDAFHVEFHAQARPVGHGDEITVGAATLRVIHLRGHTPGSIALLYADPAGHPHLFTGDSLFPGGVGKTNTPETFASLIDDVEQRIFAELPDSTWVYPGHGNDTTLGAERPHLAEWRARGW